MVTLNITVLVTSNTVSHVTIPQPGIFAPYPVGCEQKSDFDHNDIIIHIFNKLVADLRSLFSLS